MYSLEIKEKGYRIGSNITVKASWVGKTETLMPVHSTDGLGFTVRLYAKLELGIHFVKKVSFPT